MFDYHFRFYRKNTEFKKCHNFINRTNVFAMKFFLYLSLFLFSIALKAQTASMDPFHNQVILRHYSVQDLQALQQTDTVKFNTICYYYTRSFIFKTVKCNTCPLTTAETFDVSQYEYMRKKNTRYTRHFEKYGFEVTFLSIDELQYKLPIHNAQ
jgi:hypothetical protein